jgi:hypothetical protein
MRSTLLRHTLALLATLAALLVSACSRRDTPSTNSSSASPSPTTSSTASSTPSAAAHTLHASIGGEPSELDPHIINAPPDYQAVQAFFEGLAMNDPVTLGPRPAVAERWDVSADGLTYTFHLRATARWSNGDALTSADFLYSFRRALSPALGSQYTLLFNPVRGAADYAAGKLTDFNQVGFAAPDPRTLVVTLARPTPYFLSLVAGNPVWFPVHRATIERHGKIDQRGTAWTRPERIVSNGPFVLKEWRPNQKLVGEKSATYWGAASVRLAAVHLHAIDSPDTEERAFRTGQLHVTRDIPSRASAPTAPKNPRSSTSRRCSRSVSLTSTPPAPPSPMCACAAPSRSPSTAPPTPNASKPAPSPPPSPSSRPASPATARPRPSPKIAPPPNASSPKPVSPAAAAFPSSPSPAPPTPPPKSSKPSKPRGAPSSASTSNSSSPNPAPTGAISNSNNSTYPTAVGPPTTPTPPPSSTSSPKTAAGISPTGPTRAIDTLLADSSSDLHPPSRLAKLQQCEALLLEAMPVIPFNFPLRRVLLQPTVRDWTLNALDRPDYASAALAP